MSDKMKTGIYSEIGKLEGVILHTPGREVEEMTPENAERALYSDILNLSVAGKEYLQLKGVLNKITRTFEVKELLGDVLKNEQIKEALLKEICQRENAIKILPYLLDLKAEEAARQLIQGVPLKRDNLTSYLSAERFSLRPLHNFLFTRDASMGFFDRILIGKMASSVRGRESIIMNAIFTHHPEIDARTIDPSNNSFSESISIEGGDFLVAREDVLVIGSGVRTSTQGIDFIIEQLKLNTHQSYHLLVQELPSTPESFIHLDMVFTFLDRDCCMIYKPLILGTTRFHTIHIRIEHGKVVSIREQKNLIDALKKLGIDLKPVTCGGNKDAWTQEREQWHSGANFFAFAPGQVMGYERNEHTIEEMDKNGFEIIRAEDLLSGKAALPAGKCAVTIAGSELARGGGGARCMTMPFSRKKVE